MKVNTPKRRFKGFSEDWEQYKVGKISKSFSGGTPRSSESDFYHGNIPFIRSGEINSTTTEIFITEEGLSSSSAKIVEKGNLLYAMYGATSGEVAISKITGAINQAVLAIILNENHNKMFLYYYLFNNKNRILHKYLQGGQGNLSANIIKNINVKISQNSRESIKISEFISSIDNTITLHKRKFEKLKQLQKSYLNESILSEPKCVPKRRFKGFSEDWEQRKLKDITEMISERNTDNHYQNVFTNSALHGIINQTDYFDRNIANSTNITSYYVVHKNNFIYNPRISSNAPYGPINRNKLNQVGIMSPLYLVFENRLASHDFLEYYFFSSKWYKYMLKVGNTGARSDRYAVKNKDFFNMPIFIPEYDEQCKIGNILKVLNKTISLHKNKRDTIQKTQKIYLQNILEDETYA